MAGNKSSSLDEKTKEVALAYYGIIEDAIVGTSGMAYTDGLTSNTWDSDPVSDETRKTLVMLLLSTKKALLETIQTPEELITLMTQLYEVKTRLNPPEISEAERAHDAKQLLDAQKEIAKLSCQAVASSIIKDTGERDPELEKLVLQDFEQIIGGAETSEELLDEMANLTAYQKETKKKLTTQAFRQEVSALKPSSKTSIDKSVEHDNPAGRVSPKKSG